MSVAEPGDPGTLFYMVYRCRLCGQLFAPEGPRLYSPGLLHLNVMSRDDRKSRAFDIHPCPILVGEGYGVGEVAGLLSEKEISQISSHSSPLNVHLLHPLPDGGGSHA